GQPALFMVVPDLLDHLRASYDAEGDDLGYDELFDQVRNAPLLFLDDIDAVAPKPWAKEKLLQLVNHRFNATLPTVFTTTSSPERLDDRLATRLRDERVTRVFSLEGARSNYEQVGGMTRQRLGELRFDNFDLRQAGLDERERQSLRSAFLAAQSFAEAPGGCITFQGGNGCGKTHLAGAIANKALAAGGEAFFAVVPDLLDYLRSTFAPTHAETYHDIFERVRTAGLLILDDLGAERSADWAEEKLYQIVNFRALMGLPMVVTTNETDDRIKLLRPRIYSRIVDGSVGTFIKIESPHYRLGRSAELAPGAARKALPKRGSGGPLW
ncbi:MAG: ATP-binding protein, partial [Dehalococcoidia bacterium]